MRQCPLCSQMFDDTVEFCAQDGAALLAPDPLLGAVVGAKYRVEALLGRGGMGAVYRARHLRLERAVAFKVIRRGVALEPSVEQRFNREALAVASLQHPNIVTVHDFEVTPEVGAYLVMELLRGRTLGDELRERGRLPAATALEVA